MSRLQTFIPAAGQRWAGLAGAAITSVGLLAALLGLFFQASSQPWLQPTPEVLQLAADCQARPARAEQGACLQRLVAQRTAPPSSAPTLTRLARLDAVPPRAGADRSTGRASDR